MGGATQQRRSRRGANRALPDHELDEEIVGGLQEQVDVAAGLQKYLDTVADAFEMLVKAHQELSDAGIHNVDGVAGLVEGLLDGVKEAAQGARDMAKESRVPLITQRETIAACRNDFAEARWADAELQHYTEKVSGLMGKCPQKEQSAIPEGSKLGRNQEKLRQAEKAASTARVRAADSKEACLARRQQLCELAREVLGCSAKAFRCVSTNVEPELEKEDTKVSWTSPEAEQDPYSMKCLSAPDAPAADFPEGLSPFEQDALAEAEPATSGQNPFDADSSEGSTKEAASSGHHESQRPSSSGTPAGTRDTSLSGRAAAGACEGSPRSSSGEAVGHGAFDEGASHVPFSSAPSEVEAAAPAQEPRNPQALSGCADWLGGRESDGVAAV